MGKKNFWKNRKVLITGHTGFKGAWLAFILSLKKSKIFGYSNFPEKYHKLFKILKINQIIHKNSMGDITDKRKIDLFIRSTKPEIIFHLAAKPFVIESYEQPWNYYNTNVNGLITLLEIIKKYKFIKTVVIVTTDKCYKISDKKSYYSERDEIFGDGDPYSTSKACAELIANSYQKSFFNNSGINLATVRSGNIIGGGDWGKYRIIPDIIKSIKSKKLNIRNKNHTRPWLHVFESLEGYMLLAEKLHKSKKFCGSWNFGPDKMGIRIDDILKHLIKKNILNKRYIKYSRAKFHETHKLHLNNKLSKSKLAWKEKLNIYDKIDITFDWYLNYLRGKNMVNFSINQLKKLKLVP